MIQSIENNVVIKVGTKFLKAISTILKRAAIENVSSVDPADLVQIVGEIVALPKRITTEKLGYRGFSTSDLYVGDIAIFRYDVIYQFFKKNQNGDAEFRNLVWYNGKEYWFADITKIFGVIRGGDIIMTNGYVMTYDFYDPVIILTKAIREAYHAEQVRVMHIGKSKDSEPELGINNNDKIYFDGRIAAKYQIGDKKFRIIQQKHILGVLK